MNHDWNKVTQGQDTQHRKLNRPNFINLLSVIVLTSFRLLLQSVQTKQFAPNNGLGKHIGWTCTRFTIAGGCVVNV